MNKFLQNKYSLSPEGAKKMSKGVIYSALLNISFMLPMMIVFLFLDESLNIYKFHTQARYTPIYYIILLAFSFSRLFRILFSFSGSAKAVASSNRRIGASFKNALAIEILCASPPEI